MIGINISNSIKEVSAIYVNVNDTIKTVSEVYQNINGTIYKIWPDLYDYDTTIVDSTSSSIKWNMYYVNNDTADTSDDTITIIASSLTTLSHSFSYTVAGRITYFTSQSKIDFTGYQYMYVRIYVSYANFSLRISLSSDKSTSPRDSDSNVAYFKSSPYYDIEDANGEMLYDRSIVLRCKLPKTYLGEYYLKTGVWMSVASGNATLQIKDIYLSNISDDPYDVAVSSR